jgi:hypothetical protein
MDAAPAASAAAGGATTGSGGAGGAKRPSTTEGRRSTGERSPRKTARAETAFDDDVDMQLETEDINKLKVGCFLAPALAVAVR